MDTEKLPIPIDEVTKTESEQLHNEVQKWIENKEQYSDFIEVVQNKAYIAVKAKHLLAVKVDHKKSGIRIEFSESYDEKFLEYTITHLEDGLSRIIVDSFSDVLALAPVFASIAESEIVIAGDSFGCCSRYVTCSDALKCIHPNPLIAAGCQYKKNLEQGRVFYGKNKTI